MFFEHLKIVVELNFLFYSRTKVLLVGYFVDLLPLPSAKPKKITSEQLAIAPRSLDAFVRSIFWGCQYMNNPNIKI